MCPSHKSRIAACVSAIFVGTVAAVAGEEAAGAKAGEAIARAAASTVAVFNLIAVSTGQSDQLVAKSIAVSPKKIANAAVIAQSGFIRWSATATASSFAAARASGATNTTAGA
jgi:hypothetical protein